MRPPAVVVWATLVAAALIAARHALFVLTPWDDLILLVTEAAAWVIATLGAAFLVGRKRRPASPTPVCLSPREMEVVRLIAQGLSTKQIAARLYLSPKTVDAHRVRIHKKLGVHDRVALTRRALAEGWVAQEQDA